MGELSYRPDIDGLRAVAVLAVVLHHLSAPLVPGGYVGVDVFFVISGYLITGIIAREMAEGRFTFARFYERRARRIFPALFAVLAVTLVAGYVLLLPSDMAATLRGALGTVFFASNAVFWRDMAAGYFAATDAGLNPLLHTWSLAVEEQFYVLFPVLLLACFRWARRYIVPVLVVCALVSLAGAALLVQGKSVAVFFLSPFRAWELLAGSLLALGAVPPLRSRMLREAVAGAGLLAIGVACWVYDGKTTFPGLTALAPVLGAAALIHAGASGPSAATRLLQLRPVVWVGLVSYSLYLWHWPLIVFTRYATGFEPITPYIPVLFIASLGLAALSYRFIEQPFRRGASLSRRAVFASSAVFAVALSALAAVGLQRGRFESRFSAEVVLLDKERAPAIPFRACDGLETGNLCVLGKKNAQPTALLWGDSHMLAWAPVLDEIFRESDQSAVFAYTNTCPPSVGLIQNAANPQCPARNAAVQQYLNKHPEISKVVIAAYWSKYFRGDGPLTVGNLRGVESAEYGLQSAVSWLHGAGLDVLILGPVPTFEKSVPMSLAREIAGIGGPFQTTLDDQRSKNSAFYRAANALGTGHSHLYLDPVAWMCPGSCITRIGAAALYRDADHLSVAGAMALKPQLAAALALPAEKAPADPAEPGRDAALHSAAPRLAARAPTRPRRRHAPRSGRQHRRGHVVG